MHHLSDLLGGVHVSFGHSQANHLELNARNYSASVSFVSFVLYISIGLGFPFRWWIEFYF